MTELDLVAESASDLGADPARAASVARIEVAVGPHRVSGLRWGCGDPEVVFLHGGGQNAHTWDALLLQTDFPAVAFDLPGHGRSSWRTDGDTEAGRMLDLQVRLGNVARINGFLAELSAEGHYAASDNEAIVRAAAVLSRARATDLLVRIVRRNSPARLGACGDLLRRCVAAPRR